MTPGPRPLTRTELLAVWRTRLQDARERLADCLRRGPCAIGTYDAKRDVERYEQLIAEILNEPEE